MLKPTLLLSLLVPLVQCSKLTGDDDSNKSPRDSTSLSYSYEYNGCKTGDHTFSSKSAYCAGLLDEELNQGCALALRRDAYLAQDCGAKTWDDAPKPETVDSSTDPKGPGPGPDAPLPIDKAFVDGIAQVHITVVEDEADSDQVTFVMTTDLAHFTQSAAQALFVGDYIEFDQARVFFQNLEGCGGAKVIGSVSFTGNSVLQITGSGGIVCKLSLQVDVDLFLDIMGGKSATGKAVTVTSMKMVRE